MYYCIFALIMREFKSIDVKRLIESKNPKLAKLLPRFVINYLKKILHQDEINLFLETNREKHNVDFCEALVEYLGIHVQISGIDQIPKSGPVIIVLNHPLGGMDAMSFVTALRTQRQDLKFIVNDLLMNLTNIRDLFVGINKHGKNESSTRQKIHDAFESDEALCIFPAGLVSRKQHGLIQDLEWKKTFVSYARKFNQSIIPVHIDGGLSSFFYRLSNFRRFIGIKTNIEMLYLADEMYKQKGKTMKIIFGKPIPASTFNSSKSDAEWANWTKEQVYKMK